MHFLPDLYVTCDVPGNRYNRETLEVHYRGKVSDVLEMTVQQAFEFEPIPAGENCRRCVMGRLYNWASRQPPSPAVRRSG
jgi:hypothetical protein